MTTETVPCIKGILLKLEVTWKGGNLEIFVSTMSENSKQTAATRVGALGEKRGE
jgi:hypothetical protein